MSRRQQDTSKQPLARLNLALSKIDACFSLFEKADAAQREQLLKQGQQATIDAQEVLIELHDIVRKF